MNRMASYDALRERPREVRSIGGCGDAVERQVARAATICMKGSVPQYAPRECEQPALALGHAIKPPTPDIGDYLGHEVFGLGAGTREEGACHPTAKACFVRLEESGHRYARCAVLMLAEGFTAGTVVSW